MKKLFSLLLISVLFFSSCVSKSDAIGPRKRIEANMIENGTVNSYIEKAFGSSSSFWYLLGCENEKIEKEKMLDFLKANYEIKNKLDLVKLSLFIDKIGNDPENYENENLINKIIENKDVSYFEKSPINYSVWTVEALNRVDLSEEDFEFKNELIDSVILRANEKGAFEVFGGESDIDMTAMALFAISQNNDSEKINTLIKNIISFLSESQNESGGYQSMGKHNPMSGAWVIAALTRCGIDAAHDERFIKNGKTVFDSIAAFEKESGKYTAFENGEISELATSQVYFAFSIYENKFGEIK